MVYEDGEFDPDEIVHDDFGLSFADTVKCPECRGMNTSYVLQNWDDEPGPVFDDEPAAAVYDALTCPKCESENINFNGHTRAAYMSRIVRYACRDCEHSFTEEDYQEML